MQTKYKKHQPVRLLRNPNIEDIEYYTEPPVEIKKGMSGEINVILPNGDYHVLIKDKDGKKLAYVMIDEESLESLGEPKTNHKHNGKVEDWP